ncbi:MAG: hypothetical protein ACTSO7_05235 [Candidatus Heimdallarchaeota archaeon]
MAEHQKNPKRIDQWIIRSIGLITALVFVSVVILSLWGLQDNLLFAGDAVGSPIDFSFLVREIGSNFWTFRVFDIIFLTIVLFLVLISSIILVNFDSEIKTGISKEGRDT